MKRRPRAELVDLRDKFCTAISAGLDRQSIKSCSAWAKRYRYIPDIKTKLVGPWDFKYVPWTEAIHDCKAPLVVCEKSAQAALTETILNVVFYNIDILAYDVLYLLPSKTPDATDFTASRFNPALEASEHLRKIFSDVDNIGHKRAGSANLYVRGSRSPNSLKSIPVNRVFLDEVAGMVQKNIPLALERMSGKMDTATWMISTPTIANANIDFYYQQTDQSHFFFKCPGCSRMTELTFPECLVVVGSNANDPRVHESYIRCKECGVKLEHEDKPNFLSNNEWVKQFENREGAGFHINQLYSSTVTPGKFAQAVLKAETNPADEQELYNSKCGRPHSIAGYNVQSADITACITKFNYSKTDSGTANNGRLRTMGVDVGSFLHWVICEWDIPKRFMNPRDPGPECTPRVIAFGKCRHFTELDELMRDYYVAQVVVDAKPEGRKSYEFALRHHGRAHTCYYVRGAVGKQLSEKRANDNEVTSDEPAVCVDRTSWLDATLSRFKRCAIGLPREINEEYKTHVMSIVRVFEKDKDGETLSRYITADSDEDHYAHAQVYAEIALTFGLGEVNLRPRKRSVV